LPCYHVLDLTPAERVQSLILIASMQGILRALVAVSWQGWLKDLVPGLIMGHVFARRQVFGAVSAIIFSLVTSLCGAPM